MSPPTEVADWSMYQCVYHGDPHNFDQLYDPAYWTVVVDWVQVAAHVAGLMLRAGIGTRKDPCFDRLRAGAIAHGIPWGAYHAYNPFEPAQAQAQLVWTWVAEVPPLGVWADIEMGNAIIAVTLVYLAMLDHEFGLLVGIYSGGPYLDAHFTPAQQDQLDERLLWIAGYPNYYPPYGWDKGARHALHQYTDKFPLPGLPRPCDMSVPGPTWPYGSNPMPTLRPGAGHGFHGEQSNQIIPIIERGLTLGIHYKCFNSVHNPGRLRDAFDRDPNILTICRFKFPHTDLGERWENGQDVEKWSEDEHVACARSQVQLIFDNTNPWERAGIRFYTPGINEWNLTGWNANWTAVGHHLHLMMDEAERREHEFGFPIRLAVPGISQGKPEYHQMQQLVATGCFDRMGVRGDRFTVHAGRYRWEMDPGIPGLGVVIPGAPICPPYGGSGDGRINYFYALGVTCRFILTEAYDGLDSATPPAVRTARMKQTDDLYRHNPYYDGTCWYETVDNPDSPWRDTDFTPTERSDVFEKEMRVQANVANPTQGDDEMQPLYHALTLKDLAVRDLQGNPATAPIAMPPALLGLAGVVRTNTTVHIYQTGVTLPTGLKDRVVITPEGLNIWGRLDSEIKRI